LAEQSLVLHKTFDYLIQVVWHSSTKAPTGSNEAHLLSINL